MDKVRVDKWLWSIRLYKTRTKATDACKSGKILVNNEGAKPATEIGVGDEVKVRHGAFYRSFHVDELIEKRVGAPIAQNCYTETTPQEEKEELKQAEAYKRSVDKNKRQGRPTKKERREIEDFLKKMR